MQLSCDQHATNDQFNDQYNVATWHIQRILHKLTLLPNFLFQPFFLRSLIHTHE